MSPFLSYSGRGGSHRGRGRAGRGGVGRGRGRAGRGNSIDRRANVNKHKWVRPNVPNESQQNVVPIVQKIFFADCPVSNFWSKCTENYIGKICVA